MTWTNDEVTRSEWLASRMSVGQVADALRSGDCLEDRSFDRFLPRELRRVSNQHWTPLAVAARIAEWIDELGIETLVDLGSGAGKFCVATALASRCRFIGIEQRPRLVDAARSLARLFGVNDRVRIIEGTLGECAVPNADAYYVFNPFGENLFGAHERVDDAVELSDKRYERDVATVEDLFDHAPVGSCVIKYNGFGGRMPHGYEKVLVDRRMPNLLRLWRKTRPD